MALPGTPGQRISDLCNGNHITKKELAEKVLEGKYSYVLTTHIDKGHIRSTQVLKSRSGISDII